MYHRALILKRVSFVTGGHLNRPEEQRNVVGMFLLLHFDRRSVKTRAFNPEANLRFRDYSRNLLKKQSSIFFLKFEYLQF